MNMQSKKNQGFSLIELMVAMLIGLVILNGVVLVVLNSKRSFLDNQEVSQIQDNARFAIETLTRELRMAGYFGCATPEFSIINVNTLTAPAEFLTTTVNSRQQLLGVTGFSGEPGAPVAPNNFHAERLNNSDALIIRRTHSMNEGTTNASALANAGSLNVNGANADFTEGQALALISPDCSRALMFNAGAVTQPSATGGLGIAGVPAQGGSGVLLGDFTAGSLVAEVVSDAYYIGESTVVDGTPALMREVLWMDSGELKTRSEELALGIADMQLQYGIRSPAGAYEYVDATAVTDWNDVIAVQISLLMQSLKPVHSEAQAFNFLGAALPASRFLRQVASATVQVRNQ